MMTCKLCDLQDKAKAEFEKMQFRIRQMEVEIQEGRLTAANEAEKLALAHFSEMISATKQHSMLVADGQEHEDQGNPFFKLFGQPNDSGLH